MIYPDIDPAAIRFGNFAIQWYGLMYVVGILAGWWLGRLRAMKPDSGWNPDEIADMFFYGALGVMLGGRVGYVLFYNFSELLQDPLMLFRVWQGGMSFHGGMRTLLLLLSLFLLSTRIRCWAHRQFHQRGIVGATHGCTLGNDFSARRRCPPPSLDVVPGNTGRSRPVRDCVVLLRTATTSNGGLWPLPPMLRRISICGRVCSPT